MQQGRRGLLPRREAVIHNEKCVSLASVVGGKEAQQQRQRRHFTKVLSIRI